MSRHLPRAVVCTTMILLTLSCVFSRPKEDQYGGKQKENKPWWKSIVQPLEKPFRTIQSAQALLLGRPKERGREGKNQLPTVSKSTAQPPKTPSTAPTRFTTHSTTTSTTTSTTMPTTTSTTRPTTTPSSTTTSTPVPMEYGMSPKAVRNLQLLKKEQCGMSLETKIIYGEDSMPGEFPWLTLLQVKDVYVGGLKFICGGSLINTRYVLTAAHCVTDFRYKLVSVRLGEYDTTDESNNEACSDSDKVLMDIFQYEICRADFPRDYEVESFMYHEKYSRWMDVPNDIAIIRLKRFVEITKYITPVCMPVGDLQLNMADITNGTILTVAGWGMTEKLTNSPIPLKASLPLMDISACSRLIQNMTSGKLCVGDEKGSSTCFGDSGGPLILRKMVIPFKESNDVEENIYAGWTMSVLVGIVSYGPGTCKVIQPTVTTNVQEYLPWILENMDPWVV